jgi:clan AA aspartic protease (TIGR02281 family)
MVSPSISHSASPMTPPGRLHGPAPLAPRASELPPVMLATAEQEEAGTLAKARAFAEPLISGESLETGENILAHADAVEIPRAADGHYYVTLMIDGQPMEFMAKTGASGVVLSKADAERLGINLADLVFAGQSQTANGIVRTARVRLADVTLGPFHDESIGAFVNEGDMDGSLLGMEYLGRYAIEITGDQMILRR